MTDKEQIIIDGVDANECKCYPVIAEGCEFFIDHDPPSEQGTWGGAIHKGACKIYSKDCKYNNNCHFKQLARKTQECKLLKKYKDIVDRLSDKQIILTNKDKMPELYENIKDLKLECYRKALEEIENILASKDGEMKPRLYDYKQDAQILDIISKAKGSYRNNEEL